MIFTDVDDAKDYVKSTEVVLEMLYDEYNRIENRINEVVNKLDNANKYIKENSNV